MARLELEDAALESARLEGARLDGIELGPIGLLELVRGNELDGVGRKYLLAASQPVSAVERASIEYIRAQRLSGANQFAPKLLTPLIPTSASTRFRQSGKDNRPTWYHPPSEYRSQSMT